MTKKVYSTFAMLSLFLLLAVTSVQAQSGGSLQVNIRFDFQIGDKVLPAGDYTVRPLTRNTMLVKSTDGSEIQVAMAWDAVDPSGKANRNKLVFHRYGNQYFLSQVWMTRGGDGHELPTSKAEREAARAQRLAQGDAKPKTVEIAASTR